VITAADIKLLESEIMADTEDAGGRRTSRVIPDGIPGNIFPKVSRLDSVYGRVNLRKVYGGVQTANKDTYAGAHAVVTDGPDNDRIFCTLFTTGSEFDNRATARDRIESYVTSASESRMILIGRQLAGQQSILCYQRVEEPLPEIGEVYCLSNEPSGVTTTQQYVRIQDISHEIRTYTDDKGDYQKRVITVDIGAALRYEFSGPETPSRYSSVSRVSRIRETTVVDASRYFGIQKLALGAGQNDLEVLVESVYTPVVPTTNRETPISNESINEVSNLLPSKATTITESVVGWWAGSTAYSARSILPGSLVINGVTDDKLGNLNAAGFIGTVDYEAGAIHRTGGSAGTSVSITYIPAAAVGQPSITSDIEVDLNNRGTVYLKTLNPLPSPGTIIVDYRALGKWYRLRDLGDGTLKGIDAAYGVGQITYNTGALVLTLGALPDVDSSVLISWGTPASFTIRSGGTSNAAVKVKQTFTIPDLPIAADSLTVTYISNGVSYPITDDASGNLTGNGASGRVNYTSGVVELEFDTRLPDANTVIACAYSHIVPNSVNAPVYKSLSTVSSANTALGGPLVPGSLVGALYFAGNTHKSTFNGQVNIKDSGSGTLIVPANQRIPLSTPGGSGDAIVTADTVVGTINYATGDVVINASVNVSLSVYNGIMSLYSNLTGAASVSTGPANFGWQDAVALSTNQAKTFQTTYILSPIKLDLTTTIADDIVPGSLMIDLGGRTYIDRNGTLYFNVSTSTGAGLVGGTIDYTTGIASFSNWVNGSSLGLSVVSCLTTYGETDAWTVYLRTPGSPIRPGTFYVQATTTMGALVSGSSNDNGVVTGTHVTGEVNQETGVVRLLFGQMVTAAGHSGEWWYDANNVVGGMIFRPTLIVPSTLRYSCVVLTNLPLNADILGLDPVRLPMDGRVPIYRSADVVVIHNLQSFDLPNPALASSVHNVGRTDLSELWLTDANGVRLGLTQYVANLPAGTVTMAADFVAGALVQPLKCYHRIEDMNLLTDVQINGQISLAAPLPRPYPIDSYVSSALLFGDMNARVTNVFDLNTFGGWSDTAGADSNAQYNNIDYPIEVLNNGAVTERWRLNFTSTTSFQVIGENLGVILTGSIGLDCSPTNLLTGLPYFVVRLNGWGGGWSAGNQLRFNTLSASRPIWIARTILPGATLQGDSFTMQLRGDVDAI